MNFEARDDDDAVVATGGADALADDPEVLADEHPEPDSRITPEAPSS